MKKNTNPNPYIGLYCEPEFKSAVVQYAKENNIFIRDVIIEAVNQFLGLEPEGENNGNSAEPKGSESK